MIQPTLQLTTNKNLASVKNITIRDSGNKEVLEAYFLDHEGQPYNLEHKTVTFMENKIGDKFVSDPNVQIVNPNAGQIRYTLQSQVHSASGIAWFEINDSSGLVDSTANFNIRVEDGLRATADNTTYIDALEKLKRQMESLIQQADGELRAELQRAEQQLNQELQNFRNQYNSLSADFQNQFKNAQNARQQDYNNQKNAINTDWNNNKGAIWGQWNSDKANIDRQAQDTINAIKDNAKQVLDKDQADWNAKQKQWDSTFSAIVKEWQVKTNSLNSTVQDLTNKFNTIIGQVSDLMNNKIPTMNAKTDASQKKIDELRKELSNVDWTSFVKQKDLLGDTVNYYEGTADFGGASWIGSPINLDDGWTNLYLPATKYIGPWEGIGQDLWVKAGDYITVSADVYINSAQNAGKLYGFIQYADGKRENAASVAGVAYGVVGDKSSTYSDAIFSFKTGQTIGWTRVYCTGKATTDGYVNPRFESNVANNNGFFINRMSVTKTPFSMPWQPSPMDQASKDYVNNSMKNRQVGWWDIESNLNNWQLNNEMKSAASIHYQSNSRMSVLDYSGVAGQEEATFNINTLNPDAVYTVTFDFEALTTLPTLGGYSFTLFVYDAKTNETLGQADLSHAKGRKKGYVIHVWKNTGSINLKIIASGIADGQKCRWAIGNVQIREQPLLPHNIGYILNKIKLRTQSLDQNGNKFENIQTATKQSDGSYRLNLFDNDWTANKVNWLLNNTTSYNIESNTDLNNVKAPGLYHCSGKTNITNAPSGIDSWFDLYVNSDNWNGSQVIFATNANQVYVRTWHNSTMFTNWQRLINDGDYSNLQNLINSQKLKVVRSYDIERDQASSPTTEAIGGQWVVDQSALANFADAHRDVRNHTDYRYPTDQAWNTAINLNGDPYLDTGIYKIGNCAIINGPWADVDTRRWLFLQVAKYDDNSIYQTINYGNGELYSRCVSKTTNSYPGWVQFATMERVTQNVSSVSGNLQAFITDQVRVNKRVDYENPSGVVSNQTINLNNYRETGILKIVNCLVQNGPYKSDYRHTIFLKITNLDGQTQYQTVYEGDNLYGRKLYNGSGQWHKYTNTPI